VRMACTVPVDLQCFSRLGILAWDCLWVALVLERMPIGRVKEKLWGKAWSTRTLLLLPTTHNKFRRLSNF